MSRSLIMFKFAHIKYNYLRGEKAWQLLVEDVTDLLRYMEVTSGADVKDYFELKRRTKKRIHLNTKLEMFRSLITSCKTERKTCIDDLNIISDTIFKPKLKAILRGKKLLINSVGGWCWLDNERMEVLEIITNDKFVYPYYSEKDIKINRWENGTHWYVRIGNYDMPEKFIEYDDAKEAGRKYILRNNYKLERKKV
ncbi:hypothetical protein LCGC14_1609770 [marine sediment metagenome]|uniref:Uncharacterized protein n=1 Tax=marine sediment metagenome TaxID=412755 RepID=A0A0F9I8M6_9ZZZZ